MTMTLKSAKESAGKLSTGNSKMPGSTFATDAFACKVGDKLAKIEGSVCNGCYARRIQRMRPSVQKGWSNNQLLAVNLISNAPDKWVAAMEFQINKAAIKTSESYHRWFDSGDLDSVEMLAAIVKVARKTPHIKHWLPTRETGIVKAYRKQGGSIPRNLRIRISSTMIGDKPVTSAKRLGVSTSTVHRKGEAYTGHQCPAPTQGNACLDCRHCWTSPVNVSYIKH
jgi:hypothetical protein